MGYRIHFDRQGFSKALGLTVFRFEILIYLAVLIDVVIIGNWLNLEPGFQAVYLDDSATPVYHPVINAAWRRCRVLFCQQQLDVLYSGFNPCYRFLHSQSSDISEL